MNYQNQHAFRPKHSTETVLNMLTDSILKPLDDGLIAQLLLLDISSVFDTIYHEILSTRLNYEGMTILLTLIEAILQKYAIQY